MTMTNEQIKILVSEYNQTSKLAYENHKINDEQEWHYWHGQASQMEYLIQQFGISEQLNHIVVNDNGYIFSQYKVK